MSAEYYVVYRSPAGNREVVTFDNLDFTRKENEVGVLTMTVMPNYTIGHFETDGEIYIYRSISGMPSYLEGETFWFVRRTRYATDANGQDTIEITAFDAMDLLKRRIIAYMSGTVYTDKVGIADDLIKDVIRENYGTLAFDPFRDISGNLLVQADLSMGAAVTAQLQDQIVLDAIRKISDNSRELGIRIIFDVVAIADDFLEFRTYKDFRGVDHSSGSTSPVTVGYDFGSMSEIELVYDYSEERNAAYVGGEGKGTGKDVEVVLDNERIALSPYNRCEMFVNANNVATVTGLQNEGNAALSANRPKLIFSGRLLEVPGVIYGVDFKYGDLLTAIYKGISIDCRVDTVHITFNQSGGEQLDLRLHGEFYL